MRIAILYDVVGWAYHSEALGLQKFLKINKPKAEVDLFAYPFFYEKLDRKKKNSYDCVLLYPRQAKNVTFRAEKTAVRFSSFGDYSGQAKLNTDNFGYFICMNKQIEVMAKKMLPHRVDRIGHIPVAVDTDVFRNTGKRNSKKLNIGFCGNSGRKGKGFDLISETMKDLGAHVNFKKALYKRGQRIDRNNMYKFYNDLDLIVCMSTKEGGPLPPFEAGACGVPTISSCSKSAINEVITNNFNGFIIDRSAKGLIDKILEIYNNRELLKMCSENIEKTIIENHSWSEIWSDYYDIFKKL
jgi:glycosyltransferase involved in cell wall biosynthesis